MKKYIKEVDKNSIIGMLAKMDDGIAYTKKMNEGTNLIVYTSKDLCDMLHINEKLLRKYRYEGKISYSRQGDKYWYTQQDIDEFMLKNRRDTF